MTRAAHGGGNEKKMTNPFFFLAGCPRSGTTLLHRILDHHPQIAIVPKIRWIAMRYEKRNGVTAEGMATKELIEELLERDRYGRSQKAPAIRGDLEEMIARRRPVSYAELLSRVFDRYGETRGRPLVGNRAGSVASKKTCSISTLHNLWPHAKFLHLIRDGRDVCLSAMSWNKADKLARSFAGWRNDPVSTTAAWWKWQVELAREAGSALARELYFEVRYESLVNDPEKTCRALCEFLGVPFDRAMLQFYESEKAERKKKQKTGVRVKGEGVNAKHAWMPITPGLRNWRKQMALDDIERFEAVAGELLDQLGYPRGAAHLRTEILEHASKVLAGFEGRPLPRSWEGAAVA